MASGSATYCLLLTRLHNVRPKVAGAHFRFIHERKARKPGVSQQIREQFSELQTVWRWCQSPANPSLLVIPGNREKYREIAKGFDPLGHVNALFLRYCRS